MKPKLVIVEGLPGSGKTTWASSIHNLLRERGLPAQLYPEGDPRHPADYEATAWMPRRTFRQIRSQYPDHQEILKRFALPSGNHIILPYGQLSREVGKSCPEELVQKLASHDIYEIPLEWHMSLVTERWRQFTQTPRLHPLIFECCLIQNPVTVTMLRDNAPKQRIIDYVLTLCEIIRPLDPVILYLDPSDLEERFRRVFEERPERWQRMFVSYCTQRGYGKAMGLEGLEGTLEVMLKRRELELEILPLTGLAYEIIDNTLLDEKDRTLRIDRILNL